MQSNVQINSARYVATNKAIVIIFTVGRFRGRKPTSRKRIVQTQANTYQWCQTCSIPTVSGRPSRMPKTQGRCSGSEPGGGAMLSSQETQPGVTFDGLAHNVSAPVAFFDCAQRVPHCSEDTNAERTYAHERPRECSTCQIVWKRRILVEFRPHLTSHARSLFGMFCRLAQHLAGRDHFLVETMGFLLAEPARCAPDRTPRVPQSWNNRDRPIKGRPQSRHDPVRVSNFVQERRVRVSRTAKGIGIRRIDVDVPLRR